MLKRGSMLGFVVLLTMAVSTPWAVSAEQAASGGEETRVPAFNPGPPAKDAQLPPILGKEQLWGNNEQYPFQTHAYELAAKIQNVIYQQPCYCYCDRSVGHKSLLDCFASTHGTQCDICQKEAVLAYQQTQKGKTPAQIRAAIIRGDWKTVDMKPYMTASSSR